MTNSTVAIDRSVERWWLWFAIALFLLIPLDLFTTFIAVAKYGTAVEANPVMRWLLEQGLFAVTAANLVVVGLAVYLFQAAVGSFRRAAPPYRRTFARIVDVWISVLIAAGIVLITNNLLAIF